MTQELKDERAALIVRDCCETDPADPDKNHTICISVSDLLEIAERHIAAQPQATEGAESPRYIVIGYGESDYPDAVFVDRHEDLLDAVLGMMYTKPSDADNEMREAYRRDLEDEDEWCGKIWRTEFEIGGIVIYDTGERTVAPASSASEVSFQSRVQPWMLACFGAEIAADRNERNHRFFEEAGELVQACGMTASEAHQLVDYTWARPVGEKTQEAGGVMVTLAALCLANRLDMHAAGETELARISEPAMMAKICAKQAAKPKHSPLPIDVSTQPSQYHWRDTGPLETGEAT